MSDIDAGDVEFSDPSLPQSNRGSLCCLKCRRLSSEAALPDHYERAHKRHTVVMEPGELEAVVELIRNKLVTDRIATGGSVFAGPRSEKERLLWNFFVRHDKRLRKLWSLLNTAEDEFAKNEGDEPHG